MMRSWKVGLLAAAVLLLGAGTVLAAPQSVGGIGQASEAALASPAKGEVASTPLGYATITRYIILSYSGTNNYSRSRLLVRTGTLDYGKVYNYLCLNSRCSAWKTAYRYRIPAGSYIYAGWNWTYAYQARWYTKGIYDAREDGISYRWYMSKSAYF